MVENKIVVVNTQKPTLKEEAKAQGRLFLAECVDGIKKSLIDYATAMISRLCKMVIDKLQ